MGPFYNLIAIATMLSGVYIANRLSKSGALKRKNTAIVVTVATALGIAFRVIAMSIVNYIVLRQGAPFGFGVF